jgi:predicted dehydrogenase
MSPFPSRRRFLKTSAAIAGAALGAPLAVERSAHAAGSGAIRIGLIGCGGRGTKAAANAMNAGADVRLVALADLFPENLRGSLEELKKSKPDQVDVSEERRFLGFDAYQRLIATDVDVVLIAAASHFHPTMLAAAVAAGKHVFCEKPHGIDVPGVKASVAASEEAAKKGLCLVSGLCWRYDAGVRETVKRIQGGAIGEVVAIQETYASQPYNVYERPAAMGEFEYQIRNWYHFNWLSGDQTAQQLIHSIDKASWVLGDVPPVKVWGMGGRQACVEAKYGDQYDHHAVVFEYPSGVRVFGLTRDMPECYRDTSDWVIGTKGRASLI